MARGVNQKAKLLVLSQYLLRESDEEHPVSTAQIIQYLESQGISAERKSLYDDMEVLSSTGLDIVKVRHGNVSGWYVGQRDFQAAEVRLLVDSIQSSRFITMRKSLELIRKLEGLSSRHQAKDFQRQVWVKNRIKSMNESIYYLVDDIQSAIGKDRRIRFKYFLYNEKREKVLRHDGQFYEVSPLALLWEDENYYLVGYETATSMVKHFRVDKMMNLRITEEKRLGTETFARMDMAAYTDTHFNMFSGEPIRVRLEFSNDLAGAVIDRFGLDTMLVPSREGYFTVTIPAAVNEPFFGWLCSFGDKVRLLSPPEAVEAMRKHTAKVFSVYSEKELTAD